MRAGPRSATCVDARLAPPQRATSRGRAGRGPSIASPTDWAPAAHAARCLHRARHVHWEGTAPPCCRARAARRTATASCLGDDGAACAEIAWSAPARGSRRRCCPRETVLDPQAPRRRPQRPASRPQGAGGRAAAAAAERQRRSRRACRCTADGDAGRRRAAELLPYKKLYEGRRLASLRAPPALRRCEPASEANEQPCMPRSWRATGVSKRASPRGVELGQRGRARE